MFLRSVHVLVLDSFFWLLRRGRERALWIQRRPGTDLCQQDWHLDFDGEGLVLGTPGVWSLIIVQVTLNYKKLQYGAQAFVVWSDHGWLWLGNRIFPSTWEAVARPPGVSAYRRPGNFPLCNSCVAFSSERHLGLKKVAYHHFGKVLKSKWNFKKEEKLRKKTPWEND